MTPAAQSPVVPRRQDEAELQFMADNLRRVQQCTLPNMVPLVQDTTFGTTLHGAVNFHCARSREYLNFLRANHCNPSRQELPNHNIGVQALNTLMDQIHAASTLLTDIQQSAARNLTDFHRMVEWQAILSASRSGMMAPTQDQATLDANEALKAEVDEKDIRLKEQEAKYRN